MTKIKQILLIIVVTILYLDLYNIFINGDITLACGLFGFIGINPEKYFNWDKFNILGWANDSRGGDACGRVLGNLAEHGVDTFKTYKEFAIAKKNPAGEINQNTILGHCRKASSGGKDNIYAQPIILKKKDVNLKSIKDTQLKKAIKELKDDDIVFSGIHNGTIENYKELAPQYGIPIADHNDSKVLLSILFYGNYDVLVKYIGTAVLVWHNHITNKTYIFKGASKYWDTSPQPSEERPLYYWEIDENNFYFSSLEDSLLFIGATKDQTVDVDTNTLFILKDGLLIKKTVFDRTTLQQNKTYNSNAIGYNRRNNVYHRNLYWHDERIPQNYAEKAFPTLWSLPKDTQSSLTVKTETLSYIRNFSTYEESVRLQAEISGSMCSKVLRRAVFNKGRYWMNGGLMHGIYLLNPIGLIPNKMTRDASLLKPYYFIEGIMMDGYTGYNRCIETHSKFIETVMANVSNDILIKEQDFTEEIVPYSKYPTVSLTKLTETQDCMKSMRDAKSIYYTGEFQPLFSDRKYSFDTGDLTGIVKSPDSLRSALHIDDDATLCNLYLGRCEREKSLDPVFTIGKRLLANEGLLNSFSPFQNIFFAYCDPKDGSDVSLFFVHFIRDFRSQRGCALCANEKTTFMYVCTMCETFSNEVQALISDINYEVFK